MKEPIRILQVVPNMQQGGLENLIMNIYRNIDRTKVQFDFLVHYKKEFFFDKEIEKLGGKIYRFSVREDNNFIKYYKDLCDFFKEHSGEYRVVHGHMASLAFIYLRIAKKYNIPVRIIHSHGTSHLKNIKGYLKYFTFKMADKYATDRFACSTEAGKYLFGVKNFKIINNAIDMDKFKYNESLRRTKRNELQLEDKFVIGHIGRFNLQKNHKYLIKFFSNIVKKNHNARLLLIGIGEELENIKDFVRKLNISDYVFFLGQRNDVCELYQAMDVFCMPSKFEGLPLTGIEAQVSGLPCVFSDQITREVKISNNCIFLPLDEDTKKWEECVETVNNKIINRLSEYQKMKETNYNIKILSKNVEGLYLDFHYKNEERV